MLIIDILTTMVIYYFSTYIPRLVYKRISNIFKECYILEIREKKDNPFASQAFSNFFSVFLAFVVTNQIIFHP